jgi:hypothetical protein
MTYKRIIIFALAVLLCGGCGLKEGIVEKEPKSYLWFTGNLKNTTIYIDNLSPIILNKENSSETVHYELSPGKHSIVVKKSGEVIVDRSVLLGNGITKEIQIP